MGDMTRNEELVTMPWILQIPAWIWLGGGLFWLAVFGYWGWSGECIASANQWYWCSFSGPIDWWYRGCYLKDGPVHTIFFTTIAVGGFLAVFWMYVDGVVRLIRRRW